MQEERPVEDALERADVRVEQVCDSAHYASSAAVSSHSPRAIPFLMHTPSTLPHN